jgi:hypothetical protein
MTVASNQIPLRSQKQEANVAKQKRQYQEIWEQIKKLPVGQELRVRCHPSAVKRIIQAVRKEKTAEVGTRKKLEMLRAGPLKNRQVVEDDGAIVSIYFSLEYDGTKL